MRKTSNVYKIQNIRSSLAARVEKMAHKSNQNGAQESVQVRDLTQQQWAKQRNQKRQHTRCFQPYGSPKTQQAPNCTSQHKTKYSAQNNADNDQRKTITKTFLSNNHNQEQPNQKISMDTLASDTTGPLPVMDRHGNKYLQLFLTPEQASPMVSPSDSNVRHRGIPCTR